MLLLSGLLALLVSGSVVVGEEIALGSIMSLWREYNEVFAATEFALEEQHNATDERLFHFTLFADNINTVDAFKLTRIICRQLDRGVFALLGTVDPESLDTLHSYSNALEMPFVTPFFPDSVYSGPRDGRQEFAVQLMPDYQQALVDLIKHFHWSNLIFVYCDFDGLLRLQRLLSVVSPAVVVESVRHVTDASSAILYLEHLEQRDRHGHKHILLDCPIAITKSILIRHVHSLQLGRRNYHYLVSSLIFDDSWDDKMDEYGALNVTGLRIVRKGSEFGKKFANKFDKWLRLRKLGQPFKSDLDTNSNTKKSNTNGNGRRDKIAGLSAMAALAYDSVRVLSAAFRSILMQRPALFNRQEDDNDLGHASCSMSGEERHRPWAMGNVVLKAIKEVDIEGLTGHIRFDSDGRRSHFELDVVQMNADNRLKRVAIWSDQRGLVHLDHDEQRPHRGRGGHQRNRTFVATTLLQAPFVSRHRGSDVRGNARYEGFIPDLTALLERELSIRIRLKPIKSDTKLKPKQPDLMLNELVSGDADLALGPLAITSDGERVVDFTLPFMSTPISMVMRLEKLGFENGFGFVNPFSVEVWYCVAMAVIAVATVLFVVSRFSPREWRLDSSSSGASIRNSFTIIASLWFVCSSLLRQSTSLTPRSPSGRLLSLSWSLFSLVMVCAYTAHMAAMLMSTSSMSSLSSLSSLSLEELATHSELSFGTTLGSGAAHFLSSSRNVAHTQMWRRMLKLNHSEQGLAKVRKESKRFVFITESTLGSFESNMEPCDLVNVESRMHELHYGVAMAKSAIELKARLNDALLRLRERGDIEVLRRKWWDEQYECNPLNDKMRKGALALNDVSGLFFVLIGSLLVALVVALVEFCANARLDAKRQKRSVANAIRNKARLALANNNGNNNGNNSGNNNSGESQRFFSDSSAL